MSATFNTVVLFWGCAGSAEIKKLQKLKNRAARILTNSSFHTPSRPLFAELGWKTTEELIGNETKTMVFKLLNDLVPQYLYNLFIKTSACSSHSLRNTETDIRLPKKSSANGINVFLAGELNYGIAFLLGLSRHPSWVVSKHQYRVDYFLLYCKYHVIVNSFCNSMVPYFLVFYCIIVISFYWRAPGKQRPLKGNPP